MLTYFDTETSGLYSYKKPAGDPSQPRILSLGAVSYDDTMENEIHTLHMIVRPNGFTIDNRSKACMVNGITQEYAEAYGVSIECGLHLLANLAHRSRCLFSFNKQFDWALVVHEATLLGKAEKWFPQTLYNKTHCVMLEAARAMKVAGDRGDYRWPKLEKAYEWCYGRPPTEAHNSLGDSRTAAWVAYWLLLQKYWELPGIEVKPPPQEMAWVEVKPPPAPQEVAA
jgi:DNA polymerase-3 subunit epsilon